MRAIDVIRELPRHVHGLSALYFQIATPVMGGVHDRLQERGLPQIDKSALGPRERWNESLEVLLEHGTVSDRIRMTTNELERLDTLVSGLQSGQILVVCSTCELTGQSETCHLPLIDFNCPADDVHRDFLAQMLANEGLRGYLLKSGQSFHFFGIGPLSQGAWLRFLGRLLLLPYVDSRYVGHRIIDSAGTLRLTASASKREPVVSLCP